VLEAFEGAVNKGLIIKHAVSTAKVGGRRQQGARVGVTLDEDLGHRGASFSRGLPSLGGRYTKVQVDLLQELLWHCI
jgi:hypothetical protein